MAGLAREPRESGSRAEISASEVKGKVVWEPEGPLGSPGMDSHTYTPGLRRI